MPGYRMLAVALAAMVLSAGTVEAQERRGAGERPRAPGAGERGARPGAFMGPGMRGLQLSETERTAMQAVRTKYQPLMEAAREAARPHMEAMRAARTSGDTAAFRQAYSRSADARQRMVTLRTQMAAEMRAALGAENRARLDSARTRGPRKR
jgi:Spy/CpxP family protein refolding chaperone